MAVPGQMLRAEGVCIHTPPLPVHVVDSDYTYAAVNHLSCTHPRGRELLLTLSRPFPLKERLKVLLK